MTKPGLFITVEGGEGVGKSTNIKHLTDLLDEQGIDSVTTREPGGTPLAEQIRGLLLKNADETVANTTELLLMFAARAQHLAVMIEPALAAGTWVICDRFTDASYAYQAAGRGMSTETVAVLERLVQGERRPDATLLLDAPVETGMARARGRGELDRFEQEDLAFMQRVRECYLSRAEADPDRIAVIDASRELEQVCSDVSRVVATWLLRWRESAND